MGLSIHYRVHLANADRAAARRLVQLLHRQARALAGKRGVDRVFPLSSAPDDLERFATLFLNRSDPRDPHTIRGIDVPPIEGTLFPVKVGAGCEPLWLGLCRYPTTVRHADREVATGLGRGWRLQGACKTQYASQHGWEHFHRCHTTVILLLRHWDELGARVRILDEGGWWPRRSDAALQRKLEEMNRLVAAFAGAMKDAAEEGGPRVEAAIFDHPQFEHLEADGVAHYAAKVAQAQDLVAKEMRRGEIGPTP